MSIVSDLPAALTEVRRAGDFFAHGVFDWRAPSLRVKGVGAIALPLVEEQARRLISAAEFAPYGRREETIVDASVRNCWQIAADRVEIAGALWDKALAGVAARAADGLGVEGNVEAVFYKLLIYEPGGFFLSHRDTEKCPGMFATLILAPAGVHSGGELAVRHGDREALLDLNSTDPAEASFAAFYADCPHEVKPIETGYRLVLLYNLRRKGKGQEPKPPNYDREAHRIAKLLQRWRDEDGLPEKIVFPLEHAYTPAELSFAALKGADQAIAKTICAAACEAGCDLHLALLTVTESGAAEYTGSYSRRGRWGEEEEEFEAGEVLDRDARLSNWKSQNDENCDFPALGVTDDQLSPPGVFDDLKPDEEYFGEATGNEGASFDRTYRRAALVLWPSEGLLSIIAGADLPDALRYLKNFIERAADAEARAQAKILSDKIATRLADKSWFPSGSSEQSPTATLLELLQRLDYPVGIERCIEIVLPAQGLEPRDVAVVLAALSRVKEVRRAKLVERFFAGAAAKSFAACANLLRQLVATSDARDFRAASAYLLSAIPQRSTDDPDRRAPQPDPDEIADMLAALPCIDEGAALRAVEKLLAATKTFSFDRILVPALRLLAKQNELVSPGPAIEKLRAACLAHLRARAAEPLTPPADWRRASVLGCKCRGCTDFSRFLDNPAQKLFVLRAAESARSHLEQTIRAAHCDIDTKTERKGRPYSLICEKNQASYDRRVAQRKEDVENISILQN
jgi:hypothetical protein